jgi:Xaa-Pro aminopeptidase
MGASRLLAVSAGHVTMTTYERMRSLFPAVTIVPADGFLNGEMAVKSDEEIERMRAAQALTAEVFEAILPILKPGAVESDIAAEIVYQHLLRGAERMSFDPIVASGPRGALPHARASERALHAGDMVVIDIGGVLDGYAADLTRTVAIGDPGDDARGVYDVVREAQRVGKAALAPQRSGREVDAAAREVIGVAGFAEAFTHSLGHGIGLETHEWPRLSQHADDVIPDRATVTVEPGVYLPDRFGIRIEDVVVVRAGGAETLTPLPTELIVL